MRKLPKGTVTFVFTDIEGSTRLLHTLGDRYRDALEQHRTLLRAAFTSHAGVEVDTQGDAFFVAFPNPREALLAAIRGQRAIAEHPWPPGGELRVRMGIHTGTPEVTEEGYVGSDVHLGARICAAAWGGQILLSPTTAAHFLTSSDDISVRSVGTHALKDIDERVELSQVIAPGLRQDFPSPRTIGSHPTNLPPVPTPLVGRDHEVAYLTSLVRQHDTQVVTLTGPGGSGKTRLALEAAHTLLPEFADGVLFVDLSALTDALLVVPQIAAALNLTESGGRSLTATLHDHLSSKDMLLLLDNFEQVTDAALEVSALVSAAHGVPVLVTSREPLRIAVEQEVAVLPLAVPSHTSAGLQDVERSPAVALFVERARRVRANFALTADNAAEVAAICRRLDGLPLALELAAARVKVLSPSALLDRLEYSLKVLSSARRDTSERQRTLRGAIAWSYDLLSSDEQTVFRSLGVFAGGWSLEAAEQVCERADLDLNVLDGLGSLVDKSLVRAVQQDDDRFSMLETIREFAIEKLDESAEAEKIRWAHAEFFEVLAAAVHSVPRGEETETHHLDQLEDNQDNLRSALSWAAETEPALALSLAAKLARYWYVRGYLREGRAWLERILATSNTGAASERANAGRYLAVICFVQGDIQDARTAATTSLILYRSLGDEAGVARALEVLALTQEDAGELSAAQSTYLQAIASYERAGDQSGATGARGNLGMLLLTMGQPEAARDAISESLAGYESLDDKEGVATSLLNLGWVALATGATEEADSLIHKGVRLVGHLRHSDLFIASLEGLAALALRRHQPERAANLLGVSSAYAGKVGVMLSSYEKRIHDQTVATVRGMLGETVFESFFRSAKGMSVEAAIRDTFEDGNVSWLRSPDPPDVC